MTASFRLEPGRNQDLLPYILLNGSKGLIIWTIFHCLPKHIDKKLGYKWSSQGLNWCSDMGALLSQLLLNICATVLASLYVNLRVLYYRDRKGNRVHVCICIFMWYKLPDWKSTRVILYCISVYPLCNGL